MAFMKIKPTDTLFFRGGKPFNAGGDSWADSGFLPNPSTIWGALFSILYKEDKINKLKENGKIKVSKEERKRLTIKNIYLYQKENSVTSFLVPTPLDVYIDEYEKNYTSKIKKIDFISNHPLKYISTLEKDNIDIADKSFIRIDSLFKSYQIHSELSLYSYDKLFKQDYKIGIKLNRDTRTVQENYLYRIDLTQFEEEKESGFIIEYEFDGEKSFESSGILNLGGEGKTAKFETIEPKTRAFRNLSKHREKSIKQINEDKCLKLYFKTPAYLKCAWQPNRIQGLKLLSANVGKYLSIGGFDMETNKPKKMQRFIPAGSVYVYKIEDEAIDWQEAIKKEMEFDESYKGFGLFELLSVKEKIDG